MTVVRRNRVAVKALLGIVCLAAALVALDCTLFEHKRRWRASDSIRHRVNRLVLTTPSGLNDDEWAAAVRWTDNLHANSMLPFQATLSDIRDFETSLVGKLSGDVDMQTIAWIWDQYAELTSSGNAYKVRFQPTMYEYMKVARTSGDVYGDYASFRTWVAQNELGTDAATEQSRALAPEPATGPESNGESSTPAR